MANKAQFDLSGGMNTKVSPLIIKDNESELILNYNLDKTGALQKRLGATLFLDTPVTQKTIYGMYQFNDSVGSNSNQVMVANNSGDTAGIVYKNNGSGAWTSAGGTHAASVKTRFATFLDYLFRVNGSNTVATTADLTSWGTTNAPATIIPTYIAVFQDRVYVANDARSSPNNYPSRVYFSSLPSTAATPVITWTTGTDYFDVNPDDGDQITALENNGNRLLIFKNRSLYRWNFGQVEPDRLIGVGTQSQECVKTNFDLGITFFANQLGVYAYTGGRPKLISRKIQKWWDAIPLANFSLMAGEVDEEHYYVYLGDSLTVDQVVYRNVLAVYHIALNAWTIYALGSQNVASGPMQINFMCRYIISSEELIHFGGDGGGVFELNKGTTDNTASIISQWLSKEYLLQFPYKTELQYIDVVSQNSILTNVEYRMDRKFIDRMENPLFNSLTQLKERFTNGRTKKLEGHSVQLRMTDISQMQSLIEGINIEHQPIEKRWQNLK